MNSVFLTIIKPRLICHAFVSPPMLFASLALLFLLLHSVRALPTWEGLNPRSDFTANLVPSTTFIEVLGPPDIIRSQSHLTSHAPGEPGNLTAIPTVKLRAPSLFSVSREQLWQYKNWTTIYPVVVKNTTDIDGVPPLQLVLGKQRSGTVIGGRWRWQGSAGGNRGIFYTCPLEGNGAGIFMFLEQSPTPAGCHIITLQSVADRIIRR
ncbi:hypothetical protein R3P38DRAFT_3490612 [Favolaschia claudopus]|uniref:Uncharacterized protein n=1 Tax=Favolaschia claudopus TaxID=2862362 RepID=A0AAW0EB92_9AGAR